MQYDTLVMLGSASELLVPVSHVVTRVSNGYTMAYSLCEMICPLQASVSVLSTFTVGWAKL